MTHKKQKGKKKVSLELFRVKEPGVALEMLEIEPTPVRVRLEYIAHKREVSYLFILRGVRKEGAAV